MFNLAHFQQDFKNAVLSEKLPESFLDYLTPCSYNKERMAVYRNNVFHSLSSALSDTFPVVKQLIGHSFFQQLSVEYIRQFPPSNSAILFYGEYFAQFIAQHSRAKEIEYLNDVAQLEWLLHASFNAADASPLPIESLSSISPEQLVLLRFKVDASVHLLKSPWPVIDIWQYHQSKQNNKLDISEAKPCYVVVYREDFDVKYDCLSFGEFLFLEQLCEERSIVDAWSIVTEKVEPNLDLSIILSRFLKLPLFIDYQIGESVI